jgi:hypothetical protein
MVFAYDMAYKLIQRAELTKVSMTALVKGQNGQLISG